MYLFMYKQLQTAHLIKYVWGVPVWRDIHCMGSVLFCLCAGQTEFDFTNVFLHHNWNFILRLKWEQSDISIEFELWICPCTRYTIWLVMIHTNSLICLNRKRSLPSWTVLCFKILFLYWYEFTMANNAISFTKISEKCRVQYVTEPRRDLI